MEENLSSHFVQTKKLPVGIEHKRQFYRGTAAPPENKRMILRKHDMKSHLLSIAFPPNLIIIMKLSV